MYELIYLFNYLCICLLVVWYCSVSSVDYLINRVFEFAYLSLLLFLVPRKFVEGRQITVVPSPVYDTGECSIPFNLTSTTLGMTRHLVRCCVEEVKASLKYMRNFSNYFNGYEPTVYL